MASDLPPYSGRHVACPKCRTTVRATWHKLGLEAGFPCTDDVEVWEHMCRTCEGCGFGWVEATADASPDLHALPGGAEQ